MSKHAPARRPRPRTVVVLVIVATVATVASIGLLRRSSPVRAAALASTPPSPSAPIAATTQPAPPDTSPRWSAFARAGGVKLYLPVARPVGIYYHEASFDDAMRLHPLGRLVRNANGWGFTPVPKTPGPGYTVMSSRGRGTPATSAADVVVPKNVPVRSPVTGTVLAVAPYRLYCTYPDIEVTIRPDGGSRDDVAMIHLRGVKIAPGDRVFATLSVIGFARPFPFRSQVDDYVRGGNPHVHIEITKPHPARRATC